MMVSVHKAIVLMLTRCLQESRIQSTAAAKNSDVLLYVLQPTLYVPSQDDPNFELN